MDLKGILEENIRGVDDEIAALEAALSRWGGDKTYEITAATPQGTEGDRVSFAMETRKRVWPPEYTSVVIGGGEKVATGYVESPPKGRDPMIVSLEGRPKFNLVGASVSFDPTEILRRTRAVIEQEMERPTPSALMRTVLGLQDSPTTEGKIPDEVPQDDLTPSQARAARLAMGSPFLLNFGPPGTGKTLTLGRVVAGMYHRGERTYILAPTNTAVDEAVLQTAESIGSWEPGDILRVGRAGWRVEEAGLTVDAVQETLGREVYERREAEIQALEARAEALMSEYERYFRTKRRKPKGASPADRLVRALEIARTVALRGVGDAHRLMEAIETLRREISEEVGSPTMGAKVIAMTLARAAVTAEDLPRMTNVVMDEASQVGTPMAVVAATLARSRLHIFGDPFQNQPIVQARSQNARQTLGTNLYRRHGISRPDPSNPRAPLLVTQFRMDPPIAEVSNTLVYEGVLETHPSVLERPPFPGPSLALVDTSDMALLAEKAGRSRKNPGTAALIAGITRRLHDLGITDIGIVTPFRPQAKEITREVKRKVSGFYQGGGRIGTIHSFQGGEKDVILVDVTATPPDPGWFISPRNRDLIYLLNVGITRPRRCLVMIGHATGLKEAHGWSSPIVRAFWAATKHGEHIRPTYIKPPDPVPGRKDDRSREVAGYLDEIVERLLPGVVEPELALEV